VLEFSPYGWNEKPSMIGRVRLSARYAVPMSVMNAVGECVSRPVPGRSMPRGETEPPMMNTPLSAAFMAS